jgi:hypothetical protein
LPESGWLLDKGWKYMPDDNQPWASPSWDHSEWQSVDPTQDMHDLLSLWKTETRWLRLHFTLDSTLRKESLALLVEQIGASEI